MRFSHDVLGRKDEPFQPCVAGAAAAVVVVVEEVSVPGAVLDVESAMMDGGCRGE